MSDLPIDLPFLLGEDLATPAFGGDGSIPFSFPVTLGAAVGEDRFPVDFPLTFGAGAGGGSFPFAFSFSFGDVGHEDVVGVIGTKLRRTKISLNGTVAAHASVIGTIGAALKHPRTAVSVTVGPVRPSGIIGAALHRAKTQLQGRIDYPPAPPGTSVSPPAGTKASDADLAMWEAALDSGSLSEIADAAERLAEVKGAVDNEFNFSIYDKMWRKIGEVGDDLIEASGTDPRNDVPTATMKLKGASEYVETLMQCRQTMVGVTVETNGLRFPFYVDTHTWEYDKAAYTSTSDLRGIWDILNFLQIWPVWFLPIQIQPISHAVFIGPLVTCIESMIAECALRIQSGINEFINNAASLNPDWRASFGTLLESNGNLLTMLKTPMYVCRTNPFFDTSPLIAKTVRMESCGTIITSLTKPYGVDVEISLWMPGDDQPDEWTKNFSFLSLDQPTYVVKVVDRSQIKGPTGTILDSVLRTVVDLEGSLLGKTLEPLLNPQGMYAPEGVFIAPLLGLDFVAPYAIMVAPNEGEDTSIVSCKIIDHTPKGWQHIVGGKSPKWLNDLINATLSWLIDSLMILIGITGIPSDLLSGFLNDAFLAFQLIEHFSRRNDVGPYHPGIERFTSTGSAPYNIEALFSFINAFWDSRGYTSAMVIFRNGTQYALGRDIFRGGLASLVYFNNTKMYTDYIENILWRITQTERDVMCQIGDGQADEAPLARYQRFITGLQEAFNVLTLAPNA